MNRRALVWLGIVSCMGCALLTVSSSGCGDDGGSDEPAAGTSGGDGDGDGDGDSCQAPRPTGDASQYISGFCGDCLCDECPSLASQCDQNCYDLIVCMHQNCDGNVGDLSACAADQCSDFSAGLAAARQIASCLYEPADKDRTPDAQTSCYIACNFGVR